MKNLLFYYPQHFNRSKEGTNPFFDRMLEICDSNDIDYDLMEEPDHGTDKPRNPKAKRADAFFWTVTVIRKIISRVFTKKDFYEREKLVAGVLNRLTFGKYRYRKYITISGSMFHLFANLNPKAEVYDLQHGILYKQHPTFFENWRLRKHFFKSNLHFLFWGKGYEQIFMKGDENELKGRTHSVGYPIANSKKSLTDHEKEQTIIVSMQFSHDISEDDRIKDKETLEKFLADTEWSGYKVLLKHHPRFNNSISIDDLLTRFKHVSLTTAPLDELVPKVRLHVTYYSTTAFEYAAYGIPTYFLPSEGRPVMYSLFYSEYDYPLYRGMTIETILSRLTDTENCVQDSATVKDWYKRFYTPFNEQTFLELIK